MPPNPPTPILVLPRVGKAHELPMTFSTSMLLYGKPSQYAIRALLHIARNPDSPSLAKDIAEKEKLPRHFLSKVLKDLVSSRILVSNMGPGGGFTLKKKPERVTLLQVIRIFEDIERSLKVCAIGWSRCSDDKPCSLHQDFKSVRESIKVYLERTMLATLMAVEEDKLDR